MARSKKDETVTVSFHYVVPEINENGNTIGKFSLEEYTELVNRLALCPRVDIHAKDEVDRVKMTYQAPIESVEIINERTAFGVFKASYWGHSYENSDKGVIPAASVSLRNFYFILYYSNSGKIYIGCQYLGHYGGYTQFKNTIDSLKFSKNKAVYRSINIGPAFYKDMKATEIKINIVKPNGNAFSDNALSRSAAVIFKKQHKEDGFEKTISDRIIPFIGNNNDVKKAVAGLVNESKLMDIDDDDITDVSMLAKTDGRSKVIYLIGIHDMAHRFLVNVGLNQDGHPAKDLMRRELIKVLTDKILKNIEVI